MKYRLLLMTLFVLILTVVGTAAAEPGPSDFDIETRSIGSVSL